MIGSRPPGWPGVGGRGVSDAIGLQTRAADVAPGRGVPLWLLVLLAAPVQFATAAFLPALPAIAADFATPTHSVQLGVLAYIAVYALGQIPSGPLSDRIGRRPVALAGAAIYTAAALASAAAPGLAWLIGLRALEGLGAGALLVAGRAALRDGASGARLTRGTALIAMWTWGLGGVAGLLGGVAVDAAGWRASCLLTGTFGALVLLLAAWRLVESRGGAAPSVLYGPVLRARVFWRNAGAAAAMIGAFYAFLTGAPAVLIGRLGVPAEALGLFQLVAVAAFCVSALGAASLVRRGRFAGAMLPAGLVLALAGGLLLLGLALAAALGPWRVGLALVVLALGAGLIMPVTLAGAVQDFPDRAGSANAAASLLQTIGAAAGAALASLPGDPERVVPLAMLGLTVLAGLVFALLRPPDAAAQAGA
jgi:DHA1 family bicyclomycin/chloramphenicol resistance-like MFS transporter